MSHWMEIARRRGESLPDRTALISVLNQQRWLWRRPADPAYDPRLVSFLFDLGTLDLVEKPLQDGAFAVPWLTVRLATGTADAAFEPVLHRLVGLAQELDMTVFVNDQPVSAEILAAAVTDLQRAGRTLRTLLGATSLEAIERAEQEAEAVYDRDLEALRISARLVWAERHTSPAAAELAAFLRSREEVWLMARGHRHAYSGAAGGLPLHRRKHHGAPSHTSYFSLPAPSPES